MDNKNNIGKNVRNEEAWAYALGMIKVDGLEPTPDFLEYVEMEKRGEITDDDLIKLLDDKYKKYRIKGAGSDA